MNGEVVVDSLRMLITPIVIAIRAHSSNAYVKQTPLFEFGTVDNRFGPQHSNE